MTPKEAVVLLQIVELAAKSPNYQANYAAPAHDALMKSHLVVLSGGDDEEKETPSSKKGSK